MNKEVFIADTAVRILASSYANSTAMPSVKESINAATELWDELVKRKIILPTVKDHCDNSQ